MGLMKSFGLSLVVAMIFGAFGAYVFDVGNDIEAKRTVLAASAGAGFLLYWAWTFTRSVTSSLRSSTNNHFQIIFKIGAFWCSGCLFSLMIRSIFNAVPLDEYLKVGVSIVCWIGMATTYLAYRRAADHPFAVAPTPQPTPSQTPPFEARSSAAESVV